MRRQPSVQREIMHKRACERGRVRCSAGIVIQLCGLRQPSDAGHRRGSEYLRVGANWRLSVLQLVLDPLLPAYGALRMPICREHPVLHKQRARRRMSRRI